jgi:4-amino-4-deoxy-L-arabinose transferase-like glycosyltransferase
MIASRHFLSLRAPALLWWLIAWSALIRGFLAWWLELGNDEVYYWTYALFPDLSHFDHPPMIGWMIQLFSLNLTFDSEFFIRLSSVVLMSVNTFMIFHLGSAVRNERTGLIAAFMYNASIYAFVITGIFILPDTPQNFFWLIAHLLFVRLAVTSPLQPSFAWQWLGFGFVVGLGMLSKYTSVLLWLGAGLFIVFYRISWLRSKWIWLAALISLMVFSPVIIWNFQNDFISFGFHGARITPQSGIRPDYLLRELGGQWLYNNPINVWLIWASLLAVIQRKLKLNNAGRVLIFVALPSIVLFLFISLFRATLPHWTGPAYVSLIPLAAAWIDSRTFNQQIPRSISYALVLLLIVITTGTLHIKYGLIPLGKKDEVYHRLGKDDPGLDMFGYDDILPAFAELRQQCLDDGVIENEAGLVGENWFPLANYDYYVAKPLCLKAFGLGRPERLHKYMWINRLRGGLQIGADYWYITNSRDYVHPESVYAHLFDQIVVADTLTVYRNGKPAKRHFVFILKKLQKLPEDPLGQ